MTVPCCSPYELNKAAITDFEQQAPVRKINAGPSKPAAIDLCAGVTCEQQECEAEPGTCDSATGECGPGPPTEDDTPCSAGSCQGGVCTGGWR